MTDHYIEKDLEDVILRDIGQFLLELEAGFTFVARQKRIQIDNDDFYIDLLFYNRKLKRLIAIELKTERPSKAVLEQRLHLAVERAKDRFLFK